MFLKLNVVLFITDNDVPEILPITTEATLAQFISDGVVTKTVSLAIIPLVIVILMLV